MPNANEIQPVSGLAMAAFRENSRKIIDEVVSQSITYSEETEQHGKDAERLITSGIQFTTQMLENAMEVGEISLMEDQLTWSMDRLPHDGVQPRHVTHRLQLYKEAVENFLPAAYAEEITSYLDWMIDRMQELQNN